jgi:hypothetical protein
MGVSLEIPGKRSKNELFLTNLGGVFGKIIVLGQTEN